ncbi:hypothetical protein Sjap_026267 [Stephania japonica]|uniref:Uncharacterized protein n=1 Tax=Stephania japonica TaxID=461633 RepID=A0AAP0E398_9MAGN
MRNQGCVDGQLNDANYSSPMPVIGLYIAAATLVCLLLMISDILSGFRNRRTWIPCKLFSLNAITLALLSIATKLPVDLTTSIPRAEDQLSKLTGTTLVCVCLGFLMPSIGANSSSECFSNIVAMAILVITIVVNICIQMHTGVIFSFHPEHIIIMCCMMILLLVLWVFAPVSNAHKDMSIDYIKRSFTNDRQSMLQRLKLCYLYCYNTNPQFMLCNNLTCASSCALCLLCSAVLLQATYRSMVSKTMDFCGGDSDYKKSMKLIVVTQIITVLAGTLGTIFRVLTMARHVQVSDPRTINKEAKCAETVILHNSGQMHLGCAGAFGSIFRGLASIILFLIDTLMIVPYVILVRLLGMRRKASAEDDKAVTEFKDLINEGEMGLDEWTLRKAVKEMKRKVVKTKGQTSSHLMNLLSKTPPSQDLSFAHQLKNHYDSARPGYEVSPLTIVLLIRVTSISIPLPLRGSLLSSLTEVFDIIHFIDRKTCSPSIENKNKSKFAKALWGRDEFNTLLPKIIDKSKVETFKMLSPLDQATEIIRGVRKALPSDYVWDELDLITDFIQHQAFGSIEELYGFVEQLFVDLLIGFLIELPNAIFKEIVESQPEDVEDRVTFSMKTISKLEKLEKLVQWSFPDGVTITNLITDEASTTNDVSSTIQKLESNVTDSNTKVPPLVGESSDIAPTTTQDEIIEIE